MRCSYDGLGRRIEKAVRGTVLRYVYDNEDLLLTMDGANALQAGLIHGPGIDQPLLLLPDADRDGTLSRGEPTRRLLTDGLGSIIAVVDDRSGTLVERYLYESFGTLTLLAPDGTVLPQSAVGNPYGFTGREVDPESGLHYFRARYYDPKIGRFLQEDPVAFLESSEDDDRYHNAYSYVENNPVRFVDPTGRGKADWLIKLGMRLVGPVWKGATATRHRGFIQSLEKMNESSVRKTIRSLEKRLAEHRVKPPSKHHDVEIRAFEEQVELAKQALRKRGAGTGRTSGICPIEGTAIGGTLIDMMLDVAGFPVEEAE